MRLVVLSGPRPAVWEHDPALHVREVPRLNFPEGEDGDKAHAAEEKAAVQEFIDAFTRYHETYDLAQLPLREGREPMVFMVGQLTPAQLAVVASAQTLGERVMLELAFGVREIRGLTLEDEQGQPVKMFEKAKAGPRLTEAALQIFADASLRTSIHGHVLRANRLTTEARKSDPA